MTCQIHTVPQKIYIYFFYCIEDKSMQYKTWICEKYILMIREVILNDWKPLDGEVVPCLALGSDEWGLYCATNCVLCWCSVLLSERAFSHCCDSVPLPLCWWHCRDWDQAKRYGKYVSSGASTCHARPCPRLSQDAIYEPHTVDSVAEVVTLSPCVVYAHA